MLPKHGRDSNSNANVDSIPYVALHLVSGTFLHIKHDSKSIPYVIIFAQGGEFMKAVNTSLCGVQKETLPPLLQQNRIGSRDHDFLLILDILSMTSLMDLHFICLLHSSDCC